MRENKKPSLILAVLIAAGTLSFVKQKFTTENFDNYKMATEKLLEQKYDEFVESIDDEQTRKDLMELKKEVIAKVEKVEENNQLEQLQQNLYDLVKQDKKTEKIIQSKIIEPTEINEKGLDEKTEGSIFTTYDCTDEQLVGLAAVAFSEQPTKEGAAAEASLMANLYELNKNSEFNGKKGAEGLYEFVGTNPKDGGWFEDADKYINTGRLSEASGAEPVTDEMVEIVRKVLCEGKRIIPGYVDEHDSWERRNFQALNGEDDITDDREEYTQYKTSITNKYGSYTFWGWSDSDCEFCDAFGYTSEENRKKIGDKYYDYDTGALIENNEELER